MKPDICPITINTTELELCEVANLIANFEALQGIADYICCIDDEITAFSSRKVKLHDNVAFIAIGGISWVWTGPNGFSSALQTPVIDTVTAAAQGLYTVDITDADGCTHKKQVYLFVDQVVCIEDDLVNLPDPTTIDEGVIFIDAALKDAKILCGNAWVDFPISDTRAIVDQGAPVAPPAATGNVTNLGEFVLGTDSMVYYIDLLGNSLKFAGTNIYNADGQIDSNRVVDGDGRTINWDAFLTWAVETTTKISWDSASQQYQFITLPPADDTQDRLLAIDATGNLVHRDQATVLGPPEYCNNVIDAVGTPVVCIGDTISLFAYGPPGSSYAWTGPNGFVSALQNPTLASTGIAVESGIYEVTITSTICTYVRHVYVQVIYCAPPQGIVSSNSSF